MDVDKFSISGVDVFVKDSTARQDLANEITNRENAVSNVDTKLTNEISAIDTKLTNEISAIDTKLTGEINARTNAINTDEGGNVVINGNGNLVINTKKPIKYGSPSDASGIESVGFVSMEDKNYEVPTVNGITKELKKYNTNKRTFMLFGDSLFDGYTPDSVERKGWGYWVNTYINKSGNVCLNSSSITDNNYGQAFAGQSNYTKVLNKTLTDHPEYKTANITDIIVYTGTNDSNENITEEKTGIYNFVTECRKYWPDVLIKIGYSGVNHGTNNNTFNIMLKDFCATFGCVYISNSYGLMCHKAYLSSDNVHLTPEGYEFYSKYLFKGALTGTMDYFFDIIGVIKNASHTANLGQAIIITHVHNDMKRIDISATSMLGVFNLNTINGTPRETENFFTVDMKTTIPYVGIPFAGLVYVDKGTNDTDHLIKGMFRLNQFSDTEVRAEITGSVCTDPVVYFYKNIATSWSNI